MQKKEADMKKARGDKEINTIPKGSYEAGITNHALKKAMTRHQLIPEQMHRETDILRIKKLTVIISKRKSLGKLIS